MPKYFYSCEKCSEEFMVYHGMREEINICVYCGEHDCVQRVPQLTTILHKEKHGQLVKEGIEENRKILDEMKKEAKKRYE